MPSSKQLEVQPDLDLSKIDRDTILHGVDDVVKVLYEQGNIRFAVSVLHAFEEFSNISGFARAKLLWGAQHWFQETRQTGDFYEKFGIKEENKVTYADRLIRMWDCIASGKIPAKFHRTRKVQEIIPISEALSQDYRFSDKVWKQLEQAVDFIEIGRIVQKAKGKQPKKGTLTLTVDNRGFITAWQDGQPHHAGTLNYADMETDPVVHKAVLRIKGNANLKDEK